MKNRLDLVAIAVLTLVALVGIVVLSVLQLAVPDVLPLVLTSGLGLLGGSALPLSRNPGADSGGDTPTDPTAVVTGGIMTLTDPPRHLTRKDTGKPLHPRPATA